MKHRYAIAALVLCAAVAFVHARPMAQAPALKSGLDRSTFTNYQESGTALWEDCLVPLLSDFADVMTAFLLPRYGNAAGLRVAYAFEKVPALQENLDAKFKRANSPCRRIAASS